MFMLLWHAYKYTPAGSMVGIKLFKLLFINLLQNGQENIFKLFALRIELAIVVLIIVLKHKAFNLATDYIKL